MTLGQRVGARQKEEGVDVVLKALDSLTGSLKKSTRNQAGGVKRNDTEWYTVLQLSLILNCD